MLDPRRHNYYPKVMKLADQLLKQPKAVLHEVDIYHDDWCGIYRGRHCNCDPAVRLRPRLTPERN